MACRKEGPEFIGRCRCDCCLFSLLWWLCALTKTAHLGPGRGEIDLGHWLALQRLQLRWQPCIFLVRARQLLPPLDYSLKVEEDGPYVGAGLPKARHARTMCQEHFPIWLDKKPWLEELLSK